MFKCHYRVPGARDWKAKAFDTEGAALECVCMLTRQGYEAFITRPPEAAPATPQLPFALEGGA